MWFGPACRTRSDSNETILLALRRVGTHVCDFFPARFREWFRLSPTLLRAGSGAVDLRQSILKCARSDRAESTADGQEDKSDYTENDHDVPMDYSSNCLIAHDCEYEYDSNRYRWKRNRPKPASCRLVLSGFRVLLGFWCWICQWSAP